MTEELDALETLVTHPGFQMVMAYARKRWKDDLPYRVKEAIQRARDMKTDPAAAVDAIWESQAAVDDVLSFPASRIAQLREVAERAAAQGDPSRRGGL